jgi:hypothetical protein
MKVGFGPFVTRTCNDIPSGSNSFNRKLLLFQLIVEKLLVEKVIVFQTISLINRGIVHPTEVLVVPFICATPNAGFGDVQWKSPFDISPATTSPLSLQNLQASVGSRNVLQWTLNYNYEHVISQVNLVYLCILHHK